MSYSTNGQNKKTLWGSCDTQKSSEWRGEKTAGPLQAAWPCFYIKILHVYVYIYIYIPLCQLQRPSLCHPWFVGVLQWLQDCFWSKLFIWCQVTCKTPLPLPWRWRVPLLPGNGWRKHRKAFLFAHQLDVVWWMDSGPFWFEIIWNNGTLTDTERFSCNSKEGRIAKAHGLPQSLVQSLNRLLYSVSVFPFCSIL